MRTKRELSRTGREARAYGATLESLVADSLEWYRNRRLAKIDKTPEAYRITGRGVHNFTGYLEPSQPDFKGLIVGGRCVVFELKGTEYKSIAAARVRPHQLKYLLAVERLGGIAFILVGFGYETWFRVPATVWADFENVFGKKSATPKELAAKGYQVPFIGGRVRMLDDFLERG